MVEQRQLAERQRVAGNAAFKARQYSEALRCYQLGLESERHNMALHANAAQAALKLSCFVQAVEHCDKLLHVADALHNNPKHELCVKALQRRATAYKALQQPQRAVEDLEKALEIAPADAEIQKQLGKARQELDEERKQRALRKAVAKSGGAATADANGGADGKKVVEVAGARVDVEKLRKLEKLVVRLAPADAAADPCAAASPAAPSRARELSDACDELSRLLCDDDACCVYFREVGGMQAAARQLASPEAGPGPSAPLVPPAPLLLLLNAACFNDANLDMLPALPRVLPACARLLGGADATAAAATLLCTASTREEVRKAVSKELAAGGGLASAVGLLTSGTPQVKVSGVVQMDGRTAARGRRATEPWKRSR